MILKSPLPQRRPSVYYFLLWEWQPEKQLQMYFQTQILRQFLTDLLKNCKDCIEKPKNETLDWYKFLSRKQLEGETLRQFWNELNGLAAKCNFGGITESLLKDVLFIVNMTNKEVQQKLCTEPETTVQRNIEFVIAYEEGTVRQKSFVKLEKINVKSEVGEKNNVNQSANKKWGPTKKCFRCEAPFATKHLKECKAMGITCMKCGKRATMRSVAKPKEHETLQKAETSWDPHSSKFRKSMIGMKVTTIPQPNINWCWQ